MTHHRLCCLKEELKSPANWIVGLLTIPIYGLFWMPYNLQGGFDLASHLTETLLWTSITSILVGCLKAENARKCLAFAGAIGVFISFLLLAMLKIFQTEVLGIFVLLPLGIFSLLHQLKMVICWSLDTNKKKKD